MLEIARTNSLCRSQLRQYYTESELRQWINDGLNGMKVRKGQIVRWQATLNVLETLRMEEENVYIPGARTDGTLNLT